MSMESIMSSFTDDGEIDEWVIGDENVELKGYVDVIEGTKMVESKKFPLAKPTPFSKILINTGSQRRIRAVFWGAEATKYSSIIHDRTILEIKRGKVTAGNPEFNNPHHRIFRLEVTVTSSSKITILDEKFIIETAPIVIFHLPINYLKDLSANVCVQGYLKQEFEPIKSYGSIIGAGVVVDGETKLQVRITKFSDSSPKIPQGTFLKITGVTVASDKGPPLLTVDSMEDIKICSDVKVLASTVLSPMGRRPPNKRKFDWEEEEKQKLKKTG
ncbi:GSCOCG00010573001-RA-CDS [Cotesia congregata]|uniref:Uncharacterized protein n=1 Tax=Cotesia congregata TaxID=51543 RepID=A0A8J2H923_COTCN|nr:GSCOCG00010573001-RA-CDS [Cotesia congregata]CAG5085160.1 Protein of unknown function [Cotesia congregata]